MSTALKTIKNNVHTHINLRGFTKNLTTNLFTLRGFAFLINS